MTVHEDIAQAMEGCLDKLRRYAPSATSGNPPVPCPRILRNVAETLIDAAQTLEQLDRDAEDGPYTEELSANEAMTEDTEPNPRAPF